MTGDEVWVLLWRATGKIHGVYATFQKADAGRQRLIDQQTAVDGALMIEPWDVTR